MAHACHQRHTLDHCRAIRSAVECRRVHRRAPALCSALVEPQLARPAMLAPSVAHEEHDSIILLPVVHQEPQSAFEPFDGDRAEYLGSDLGVGRARMQAMMERWPAELTQLDPDHISITLQGLAAVLQVRPGDAAALVSQEHRLLTTPPSSVHAAVRALASALGFPTPAVLLAVRCRPSLAFEDPLACAERLRASAGLLQVSLPQFMTAGYREPFLLGTTPATLSARVAGLRDQLQLQLGPNLLLKYTLLVRMSATDLQAKLDTLSQSLQISPAAARSLVVRYPKVLQGSVGWMRDHVTTLTQHVPLPLLQQLVTEEPSLLQRSSQGTIRRLGKLRHMLGCSKEQVLDVVTRRPSLLTRSIASLTSSYRALSIWRMSGDEKVQLVTAQPLLLRLSSQEVHGRCRWLRELMLSSGYFHSALRRLPMPLLGLVILHLPSSWARLQYLAEKGQEAGEDLMSVVQSSEKHFAELHPGYLKWLEWKCSMQACVTPWQRNPEYQNQQSSGCSTGSDSGSARQSRHRGQSGRSSHSQHNRQHSRDQSQRGPPQQQRRFASRQSQPQSQHHSPQHHDISHVSHWRVGQSQQAVGHDEGAVQHEHGAWRDHGHNGHSHAEHSTADNSGIGSATVSPGLHRPQRAVPVVIGNGGGDGMHHAAQPGVVDGFVRPEHNGVPVVPAKSAMTVIVQ